MAHEAAVSEWDAVLRDDDGPRVPAACRAPPRPCLPVLTGLAGAAVSARQALAVACGRRRSAPPPRPLLFDGDWCGSGTIGVAGYDHP